MSVFAIADLHLGFGDGVDKPMDAFEGPWVGHEEKLKERWGRLVEENDTVIIPGDLSWGLHLDQALADLAWLDKLPGTKVLIRGNHDLWWSSMAKMRGLFPSIRFIQNDCYVGEDFAVFGSRGWLIPGSQDFREEEDGKIYRRELARLQLSADSLKEVYGKTIIGAMHFPPSNAELAATGFTDIFAQAGAKTVVFGHLHGFGGFAKAPNGIIDGVEYKLCSLDKLDCAPLKIL